MLYTPFGQTGVETSRLCLGTMGFGKEISPADCETVVAEALHHGVNIIDTAESYGESEAVLGNALATDGRRDRVFLATKVHTRRAVGGKASRNSRANILASIDRSLKLLKTDYVDLYQLHHPDDVTPIEQTLEALDNIVRAGKARYVGVTNHYAWQMMFMLGESKRLELEPIVSYQTCYNILDRPIELEAVSFCRRFNVAIMAYSPLSGGLLSGKYERGAAAPPGTRLARWGKKLLAFHEDPHIHDILDELKAIAADRGVSLNQLAIQWLLGKPFVTTVILGGSKVSHYSPMYAIADQLLPEDVVKRIDELSSRQIFKDHRNQPHRDAPPGRS